MPPPARSPTRARLCTALCTFLGPFPGAAEQRRAWIEEPAGDLMIEPFSVLVARLRDPPTRESCSSSINDAPPLFGPLSPLIIDAAD